MVHFNETKALPGLQFVYWVSMGVDPLYIDVTHFSELLKGNNFPLQASVVILETRTWTDALMSPGLGL